MKVKNSNIEPSAKIVTKKEEKTTKTPLSKINNKSR